MGLVSTFILMFFFIIFYNNIMFTCSRKFDNHAESRSFIGFGAHTASQRPCECSTTTSCACCQIVTILYKPLTPKRLCFNMNYQANILNVDLSLDTLIMNSMTVANYRPFEMCAKLPGVIFSSVCVSISDIRQFPGPSVMMCPTMVLSTKKETWNIPYICSTLMANGTAGMGMMVIMSRPTMPGLMPAPPAMPGSMPASPAMSMMMKPPAAAMPAPASGAPSGMPAAMGPPPAAMGPPLAAMRPPSAAMGPSPAAMGPPSAAMGPPPAGAMRPPSAAMGPPPAAMGPSAAAMRPPSAAMGPPPAAMGPSAAAMRPPSAAMGPSPAAMGSPPVAMGPPSAAMGPPPAMVGAMMPSAALMPARPPALAAGAMPAAGARPPAPAMGAMGAGMGAKPAAPAAAAKPPASSAAAASMIIPRITDAAGNPVLLVVMNQDLASAMETVMSEASTSMAMTPENYGLAPESRFDSGITILGSETAGLPDDDKESLLIVNNGDEHTMDKRSDPESYEQNLKVENTTDTEGKLKNLNRKKRNYDIFDILHQSSRCERAYRICITRSKHYIISKLRNPKQNVQIKNGDCQKLVKIVHEPDENLCTQLNLKDEINPSQSSHPPLESHDAITYTDDDTLGAIVIQDEYSDGYDFHPQNNQYPIPLLTYTKGEMYPSRIPPVALKEALSRSSNDSILHENLENLINNKTTMLAIKK